MDVYVLYLYACVCIFMLCKWAFVCICVHRGISMAACTYDIHIAYIGVYYVPQGPREASGSICSYWLL